MLKKFARNHGSSTPFYIQNMFHFSDLYTTVQVDKNMKNFKFSMKKYRTQIKNIWNDKINDIDNQIINNMPINFKNVYFEICKIKYKSFIPPYLTNIFHYFNHNTQVSAMKIFLDNMDDDGLIEVNDDVDEDEISDSDEEDDYNPFNLREFDRTTRINIFRALFESQKEKKK